MSHLTNPMNVMQTNVQLLNKSRNFLNLITEKSTNIMEKVLLPQHLAIYKQLKSVDTNATGFCTNVESLRDIISRSDTDLTANKDNALNITNCTVTPDHDKINCIIKDNLDNVINSENEVNPSTCIQENKICDESEEKGQLSNNNLENEVRSNEKECHTADKKHPLQATAVEDSNKLGFIVSELQKKIEYLEKSNQSSKFQETQSNTNAYVIQVGNLEKTVNKLKSDLNASLDMQEALKKECIVINKEKENLVMKYVISEKQLIDMQRTKDCAERKVKELLKDQELLQNKLHQTQGERTRICNVLDGKCREITDLQREVERLRENDKIKEVKIKWSQNKLKTEMDSQKETQQKLDKALMKINDMKEECEQIRRETQESFRKFQQSEENKAVTLDQQLKEHQARLILERHVTEDKETLRLQLQKELETLKSKQENLIEENKTLSLKVQESEKTRLNNENILSNLKTVNNQLQEQITELLHKVSQLETLKVQLQQKEECVASLEAQMLLLRSANEELRSDMEACRQKEADMLDFTQKLTDKNVDIQSELIAIQTKVAHLESEHGPLHDYINELTNKVKTLEQDLIQERRRRKDECEILAKHVAEHTQLAQNFAQKLEDSQGENAVLKRMHQASIKEMTRELQQCRRKLETFEASSPSNSLDITSRTGSNASLAGDTLNGALSDNNVNGDQIHSIESNKVLMDRIIKLQNINVKRAEKLDFLEEHTQALVEELQKKEKIIQNYILQQNFGALACNERDRHKAELARCGGIMASLYNHRVSDENMTLELSLEINQKLQAVLEDTLLKNITLKGNIDTLGNEIARLTMQRQQKQIEN